MIHRNECLSFEGVILCKAVPQASQLPHLHPGQPGGAVASGVQQPGGGHLFHHGNCNHDLVAGDGGDGNFPLTHLLLFLVMIMEPQKKVRSSELSGDAVETKNLLR